MDDASSDSRFGFQVYLQQWGYHLTFFYVVLFTAYSGLAYFASITIYLVATWKCGRSCFRVGDSKAKVSYLLRATGINPDEMCATFDIILDHCTRGWFSARCRRTRMHACAV